MSNNFLPFCPTDTGTNLLNQSDYAAAADRTSGNQPGVASAKLVNKALLQSSYIASQFAQFLENKTGTNILDDATPAKLLAQIDAALDRLPPILTKYTSGSGTHNLTYQFFIASGSASAGATYTNNAVTFTVVATVASGLLIKMTGGGAPSVSGTLTKATGSGDATLTFYAVRAPSHIHVQLVGGGGGGAGSGTAAGTPATNGGNTTFGSSFLTGAGGVAGIWKAVSGGAGGAATISSGTGIPVAGSYGGAAGVGGNTTDLPGGHGGNSFFGGAGSGGGISAADTGNAGIAAATNSGSGGGGGPNHGMSSVIESLADDVGENPFAVVQGGK